MKGQVSRARETHPNRERVRKLRANGVKINLRELETLLAEYDGHCVLCAREAEKPCVDHDHATGIVRGLLCSTCNTGLGKFGDDPERLRAAAAYLGRAND